MAFNMDPKKCPMPTQDPNVRNKNFEEVALGYTEEMAVNEASAASTARTSPARPAAPLASISRSSSAMWPRATLKPPIR